MARRTPRKNVTGPKKEKRVHLPTNDDLFRVRDLMQRCLILLVLFVNDDLRPNTNEVQDKRHHTAQQEETKGE